MYTAKQVIYNALGTGLIENYAEKYSEPGYELSEGYNCILFANWNPESFEKNAPKNLRVMSRLADIAGRAGCGIEWSDEWSTCDECGGAVRTSPDCYSWRPSYSIDTCSVVCKNCIDPVEHLENLEGQAETASTLDINPADHRYVAVRREMEAGLRDGQQDDPRTVAKSLRSMGIDRFLFTVDRSDQFDIEFSVWVHESETDLLTEGVESK